MLKGKKLVLNANWCKGCGICVEYCPKNILKLEQNTISVVDIDKCIHCGLCELRCPDYAIYISKDNQ
ncbi:MAG: 4Fe-4S binding protein [Peptostreptococcaceae bacterium]|nr:4Fe-4S binding protein [Peptostreptococcaceae bacterium]